MTARRWSETPRGAGVLGAVVLAVLGPVVMWSELGRELLVWKLD